MSTVNLGSLEKGDLILVRWTDASNHKATLEGHLGSPEAVCKDWGVYLGVSGVKRKFILVGKDVEEVHNEWGATRIPLDLVEEVIRLMPRDQIVRSIREIQVLGRRVRLRRSRREVTVVKVA